MQKKSEMHEEIFKKIYTYNKLKMITPSWCLAVEENVYIHTMLIKM